MFYIACTRFTTSNYKDNIDYRVKHNVEVIYGAPIQIRNKYPAGSFLFVAEMNNETNKIEGVGLIKNLLVVNKHKIYDNNEYIRYQYCGKYWLSREKLDAIDIEISEIFDNILFKGKSHLKRISGITVLTDKLFTNWNYELCDLKNKVKRAFLFNFKCSNNVFETSINEETVEIIKKGKY